MMWPNFFLQDEEQRMAMRGRAGGKRRKALTDEQEGKIKLAFFVAIVGMTLTVLAVGTEFWVELNTYKQNHTAVCEAAHYGLWKFCYKKLWTEEVEAERATCGPAELPGEANCSYFKFFTTGENAHIFQRTTKKVNTSLDCNPDQVLVLWKGLPYRMYNPTLFDMDVSSWDEVEAAKAKRKNPELNITAAVVSLLSITLMAMGSLCITMALSKEVEFLLKPASVFFIISGILVLVCLEVFRHSVRWLISSDETIPLEYEYSWSVACAAAAGAILIFGGGCFILLSIPNLPKKPWQYCIKGRNSSDSHTS